MDNPPTTSALDPLIITYLQRGYALGLSTLAMQNNINTRALNSNVSASDNNNNNSITLNQINAILSENHANYPLRRYYTRHEENVRFAVMYRLRHPLASPGDILAVMQARGHAGVESVVDVEGIIALVKWVETVLAEGPSHPHWADAIVATFRAGFSAHEINFFAMGRSVRSNYHSIETILCRFTGERFLPRNRPFWGNKIVQEFVLVSGKLRMDSVEIADKVVVHGGGVYEVSPAFVERFLATAMSWVDGGNGVVVYSIDIHWPTVEKEVTGSGEVIEPADSVDIVML